MSRSIWPQRHWKLTIALVVVVAATLAASLSLTLKSAAALNGSGPGINVAVDATAGVVAPQTVVTFTFSTTGTVATPYDGYQIGMTYDPSKVTIDNNGPADASLPLLPDPHSCTSSWNQPPPAGAPAGSELLVINCLSASTTSGVGNLATVKFQATGTGSAIFHMLSSGDPDDAGTTNATFTDAAGEQSNALSCSAPHCGAPAASPWDVVIDISPPDVALTQSVTNVLPPEGTAQQFKLTTTNNSASTTATNVVVTDHVPPQFVVNTVSSDCVVDSTDTQLVTCTYASIAPQSSPPEPAGQINTTTTWGGADSAINTATVTETEFDADSSNNTASVTLNRPAGVSWGPLTRFTNNKATGTHAGDPVFMALVTGDPVRYSFPVINNSTTLATSVHATVTYPAGLIAYKGSVSNGGGTCTTSGPTITCDITSLAPSATTTIYFWGSVNLPPGSTVPPICGTPGNIVVQSGAGGDPPPPPCVEGPVLTVATDTDGDGYTDDQEVALGKNPNAYCAIMRADLFGLGGVNISDVQLEFSSEGAIPPVPARYDQYDLRVSDGTLGPDGVVGDNDLTLVERFAGKLISSCP